MKNYSDLGVGVPLCVAAVGADGVVTGVNELWEECLGPLFKWTHSPLASSASGDAAGHARLVEALAKVSDGGAPRAHARDVEVLTLPGDAGLPVRRRFDFFVGPAPDGGGLVLYGDPVSEQTAEQREKDAGLVDFFQNAPIALHWLSGEGIVLWANQTELNVLGYTAEEYIGQPIMKFCPDEEPLVLEIFKQLGSGNTIKDVPVRFRTKDGNLVNLLIDSNVNYNKDGSFGHTRCFIRDDTPRKVRDARQDTLLQETKRSRALMESFISRSLHLIRTPCHVLLATMDRVSENLDAVQRAAGHLPHAEGAVAEAYTLVASGKSALNEVCGMITDVADAVRFEQGSDLQTLDAPVFITRFGSVCLSKVAALCKPDVECIFVFEEGPGKLTTDAAVLGRALGHLLTNAAAATVKGRVTLTVSHEQEGVEDGRAVFAVHDTGSGFMPASADTTFGQLQNQAQAASEVELSRARLGNLSLADDASKGLGVGLNLTYALVRALGGELRYESKPGDTRFWFALPYKAKGAVEPEMRFTGSAPSAPDSLCAWDSISSDESDQSTIDSNDMRDFVDENEVSKQVSPASLAGKGLEAMDPPHVLVVEDTPMCAKILKLMLSKLGCSCDIVEDGAQAVAALKAAPAGKYGIILMDLRMPFMDGFEATEVIKKELGIRVPVVAVTADAGLATNKRCEEVGFEEVCRKPMSTDRLKTLLAKFCDHFVG